MSTCTHTRYATLLLCSLALAHTHTRHATLWFFLLHLLTHVMLRYGYLGVGLGGVGWGNDVHVNLHTHVMLRYGFFLLHLLTHVMLRYGYLGVGWGGAMTFMSTCTHTRHATLLLCSLALAHTHTRHATLWLFSLALAHTRHATLWLSWGGVGWGNDVHVNLHTHVMLRYCYVSLAQKNTLNWKSLSWVTVGENLWDHWHLTDFSKNFARPSKQWSASEKKEKSAASQKNTNLYQKTR